MKIINIIGIACFIFVGIAVLDYYTYQQIFWVHNAIISVLGSILIFSIKKKS